MAKGFYASVFMALVLNSCGSSDIKEVYDDIRGEKKIVSDAVEQNLSQEIDEVLKLHNQARAEVGVEQKLKWSDTIAGDAQKYADELARDGKFEHDTDRNHKDGYGHGDYGENLFASSYDASFSDAVKAWVDEKQHYTYGIFGDSSTCKKEEQCGHYTQVIWKDTSIVGCAKSKYLKAVPKYGIKRGWSVIVCKYQTPGNVLGEKPY